MEFIKPLFAKETYGVMDDLCLIQLTGLELEVLIGRPTCISGDRTMEDEM